MVIQNCLNTMIESNFAPYFLYMYHNELSLIYSDCHTADDDDDEDDDCDDDVTMMVVVVAVVVALLDVADEDETDDVAASHSN